MCMHCASHKTCIRFLRICCECVTRMSYVNMLHTCVKRHAGQENHIRICTFWNYAIVSGKFQSFYSELIDVKFIFFWWLSIQMKSGKEQVHPRLMKKKVRREPEPSQKARETWNYGNMLNTIQHLCPNSEKLSWFLYSAFLTGTTTTNCLRKSPSSCPQLAHFPAYSVICLPSQQNQFLLWNSVGATESIFSSYIISILPPDYDWIAKYPNQTGRRGNSPPTCCTSAYFTCNIGKIKRRRQSTI